MPDKRVPAQDSLVSLHVDRPAIESFVATHLAALHAVARALCHDRDTSEDLVAETIAAVIGKWPSIDSPLAYARRTMMNLFLNQVRHRKVIQEIAVEWVPERDDNDPGAMDAAAARIDVERALARLEPELRAVIVLRFLSDLPVADVAVILARPAGTIRRLTHDAMTILRSDGLFEGARNAR